MLGHLTPGSSQMNHWKHSKYSLQCRSTAGLLRDGMVQREMSYTNTHFTHAHTHTNTHTHKYTHTNIYTHAHRQTQTSQQAHPHIPMNGLRAECWRCSAR